MANIESKTGEASGAISVSRAVARTERGHPGRTITLGPIGIIIIDVGSDLLRSVFDAVLVDIVESASESTIKGGEV